MICVGREKAGVRTTNRERQRWESAFIETTEGVGINQWTNLIYNSNKFLIGSLFDWSKVFNRQIREVCFSCSEVVANRGKRRLRKVKPDDTTWTRAASLHLGQARNANDEPASPSVQSEPKSIHGVHASREKCCGGAFRHIPKTIQREKLCSRCMRKGSCVKETWQIPALHLLEEAMLIGSGHCAAEFTSAGTMRGFLL